MRKILIAPLALLLLCACKPTVDTYVNDAAKREAKLKECAKMGLLVAKKDEQCQMAADAQAIVVKQAASNLMNAITLQSGESSTK